MKFKDRVFEHGVTPRFEEFFEKMVKLFDEYQAEVCIEYDEDVEVVEGLGIFINNDSNGDPMPCHGVFFNDKWGADYDDLKEILKILKEKENV